MLYLAIVLCAISISVSVFLIARFGIKKKEDGDYIADETYITK